MAGHVEGGKKREEIARGVQRSILLVSLSGYTNIFLPLEIIAESRC